MISPGCSILVKLLISNKYNFDHESENSFYIKLWPTTCIKIIKLADD